ncbi:L,D-transpeptidase family protein [Sinorhizobium sp. 7-81]|nr:L,D-transpeptidase family protein [Sinorhizobium sp. 8-89]MDK1491190.1 L,D-transpeptidase family protein [Sinorhizobium sp. 8-89]
MEPGPDNPVGARALYIFQNGEDRLYRVHGRRNGGTLASMSPGCVRMINQHVMDLYERVADGSPILGTDPSKPDRS